MQPCNVINPAWEHIFSSYIEEEGEDSRGVKWLRGLLFPYIENNLDDFCHTIVVTSIISESHRLEHWAAWRDEIATYNLEGYVLKSKTTLSLIPPRADPWISSFDVMFDNKEIYFRPPDGWVLHSSTPIPMKSENRVSCILHDHDGGLKSRIFSSVVRIFVGHEVLSDLKDWLKEGARKIPLTVTKLPFREAMRLSDQWHDELARKKEREAVKRLKHTSPGKREYVGRLVIAPGAGIPAGTIYEVYLLLDQQALMYESLLQHHCVDSYWPLVKDGKIAILHLHNPLNEKDRWTVELGPLWPKRPNWMDDAADIQVRQFRGIANRCSHPDLSIGFGNLFLNRGTEQEGKSSLFTEGSSLDLVTIYSQFVQPLTTE
jgi:hypothetical protein